MLILTRRAGESLHIGNDIKITARNIQGKQVQIGIEVPEGTSVRREEVYLRVMDKYTQCRQVKDEDL